MTVNLANKLIAFCDAPYFAILDPNMNVLDRM